jgi:hypothetical protein
MTIETIEKLQKENDLTEMQDMINSGQVWKMEGSMGRSAMDLLRSGACILPTMPRKDYWGNTVPSRDMVAPGTMGSLENCEKYWENNQHHGIIHSSN